MDDFVSAGNYWSASDRNLGEGFTVLNNAGGPALLGNTRYGWIGNSTDLYCEFATLIQAGTTNLGMAELISKDNYSGGDAHYLSYSHNLIGCPETRLWTATPSQFTNVTVTDNGTSITVNAGVGGSTIAVCSMDDGASYHSVANGVTSHTFSTSVRPLYITITRANYIPLIGISGGTFTSNKTLSGKLIVFGNLTVNSGRTLTIASGSELKFYNGSYVTLGNYGILIANGNSSNPITFDFISPNSSTQNGIKFNSGSSGTINYCQIRNAYRGIYENSVSVNITNSAISGCTDGIYLYSSSPVIQDCNIHNNSNYGINLVYSSPTIKENYIQNNGTGIYCSSSSQPVIGNNSTQEGNHFSNNNYGLIVFNNALPKIGDGTYGGYNNFVNPNNNILNTTGNTVYARNNWWGTTNPANFKIMGPVSYTPYLTSAVTIGTPPLSKTGGDVYASESSEIPMLSELDKAYELAASNNMAEAREVCLNLINNYPDYSVSYNALNLLKETYTENELTAKKDIYKSLFNKKSKRDLYAMAGLILSDIDKENKLKQIDEVIETYKAESVVELALFNKLVYYSFEKEDKEKAREISKELDAQFPLSQGAIEAHKILGDEEYYGVEAKVQKDVQTDNDRPMEYSLFENYPNPFNPTTRIAFTLPKRDNVKLIIYDILGREIVRLADGTFEAGKHEFDFNAINLPSGVYFYNIQTSKGAISKKMILLK